MSEGSKDKLADYMKSPIIGIDSTATTQEAAKLMENKNVSTLLIKVDGEYKGIVTERDFTRKIVSKDLSLGIPISTITSFPLYTLEKHEHVLQGLERMKENNTRHLTVTENGKPVGMISLREVYAYYMNLFGLEDYGENY